MTASHPLLEVTRERDAFRLSGEIDLSNVDVLATTVSSEVREGNQMVFDCSDLRFIDSTGMAALLAICKGLGATGRLTLRTVPPQVLKATRVLGLQRVANLEIQGVSPAPGIAASA